MKRFSLIIIIVIITASIFGGWKVYNGIYFRANNQPLTIKCHYMAYACGDCYPQWHIDSSFAAENDLKDLIEKDIYVMYKGEQFEDSLPDSISKCIICYNFYFIGSLKKTLSDKHKFEAKSFQIKMERPGCCN